MATLSNQALPTIAARNLTSDLDLTATELRLLLDLAAQVKGTPKAYRDALAGRYLSLLFEKPSLRTRLTFELAIKQLGGDAVVQSGPIGDREPLKDVARNLDRWTDAIVARTFRQETVDELARWSSVPVINALSDTCHPCQALADMLTVKEKFGDLTGVKLAYIGDGNNVAQSLLLTGSRLGLEIAVATPAGYEPQPSIVARAREFSGAAKVTVTNDPAEAAAGADVVYTDVWASMGQEQEAEARLRSFGHYQVGARLMSHAAPNAIFMHCLPAKRGQETTDEVMESSQSVVFDQAENRLHAQKALLLMLLG